MAPPPRRPALFMWPGALFTRGACRGGLLWQRRPSVAMPRGRGSRSRNRGGGSGVSHAPAASAPMASPSYYERVGWLQQALRDRYGRGTGQGVRRRPECFGVPCPAFLPTSRQWFTRLGTPLRPPFISTPLTHTVAPEGLGSTKFATDAPMLELGAERGQNPPWQLKPSSSA